MDGQYTVPLKGPYPLAVHDIKIFFGIGSNNSRGVGKVYTATKLVDGTKGLVLNGLRFTTTSQSDLSTVADFFKENPFNKTFI